MAQTMHCSAVKFDGLVLCGSMIFNIICAVVQWMLGQNGENGRHTLNKHSENTQIGDGKQKRKCEYQATIWLAEQDICLNSDNETHINNPLDPHPRRWDNQDVRRTSALHI